MIKSLKVANLNRRMSFDLRFHEDINIITGKNGSGKTTLLKLLWYAISGNLERIVHEITFDSFELETDTCRVQMEFESKSKHRLVRLNYQAGAVQKEVQERVSSRFSDSGSLSEANRLISRASGSSIFFPTFRRIEGGFSIAPRPDGEAARHFGSWVRFPDGTLGGEHALLQQAVLSLSDRMSVAQHRFVASISTDDIVRLLTAKNAEVLEKTNRLHTELSRYILERVGSGDDAPTPAMGSIAGKESRSTLDEIRQRARNVTQQSMALLRPFTVLSELVAKVFQYRGIKLSDPVTLGEAREAIKSEVLSAGEKQMLSFLCYNAFASQACLFIDEPEISLHVDWQRTLFPVLLEQATGNQFIVATHSPFIYAKYADKELLLTPDRGDTDADAPDDGSRDHQLPREDITADALG